MNIAIFVYDNVEVLDFSGPFEVFSTASRVSPGQDVFTPFLVAERARPIVARAGYTVLPDFCFQTHPGVDLLLIPGGVHTLQLERPGVLDWIAKQSAVVQHVASVCTGVFLLAGANVIRDETVTTHWEDIPALEQAFPSLSVVQDKRWVDQGSLTTSGGISAGIDMSLYLVGKFAGAALAKKTARQMEYDWQDQTVIA